MTNRERFLAGEKFCVAGDGYLYYYTPANGVFSSDSILVNTHPGSAVFEDLAQVTHCTETAAYYSYTCSIGKKYTNKVEFETIVFKENTQPL